MCTARKIWTSEEERRLFEMYLGTATLRDAEAALGRSASAIQAKIYARSLEHIARAAGVSLLAAQSILPDAEARFGRATAKQIGRRRWSAGEEQELLALWNADKSISEIMQITGRSHAAVQTRLSKMQLGFGWDSRRRNDRDVYKKPGAKMRSCITCGTAS